MLRVAFFFLAIAASGADDQWSKVRELKSGVELRVFKKGSALPVQAKMDEATAENLLVVVKNEQVAIPKDRIDRIDSRPAQSGSRVTKRSKTTSEPPDPKQPSVGPSRGISGPSVSSSTSLSVGSRPDFETVYRRPGAAGPK